MGHVLEDLQVVGGGDQGAELNAELVLRGRHLVVMLLDLEPHLLHDRQHLAAQVLPGVDRRQREIAALQARPVAEVRSEEHTSELQSLMRISYAGLCLKKKNTKQERH